MGGFGGGIWGGAGSTSISRGGAYRRPSRAEWGVMGGEGGPGPAFASRRQGAPLHDKITALKRLATRRPGVCKY